MADIWMDVDAAVTVPVNIVPLVASSDGKTVADNTIAYNETGLEVYWNFVKTDGTISCTPITPTTGGSYDWSHVDGGMYKIEIPASGGASANNDTEGFGWITGCCPGGTPEVLPWRGPIVGFRASGLNNKLVDDAYSTTRGLAGTALPDAAADAAGGLIISDEGGLDADDLKADVTDILADTGTDGVVLAADAITAAKIADDAFSSEHFATGCISADAVADGTIDAGALASDCITSAKIADDALGAEHIADSLYAQLGIVTAGTAQSATSTTLVLAASSSFADDELNGAVVVITGGTGVGQSRVITNYTGSTDTAEVDAWTTTPSGTITYCVFAASPASATSLPAVNLTQIAGAAVSTTTAQLGVNVVQISEDATAADNAELMFDGTGYAGGAIQLNTKVATIATDAIDAASIKADAGTEIGSAVWASATRQLTGTQSFSLTGNISGNLSGSVGSIAGGGIQGTSFHGTALTLLASTAGDGVWDEALSGHTTAGTAGKAVADVLDDTGTAGVIVASLGAGAITAATIATGAIDADALATDAVNEIVDQVWDETLGDHIGSGSTGAGLTAAGAAGDPWSTSVPGAYGAGTAGYLIGTHINAPIGTVDTVVDAIKVKTDYLPSATAGTAGGVFIAGANAATSVSTALTANITGNLSGSVGSVTGSIGSVALKKNTALAKFPFVMRDTVNHAPATGLTVTAVRSIDGAAFGAGSLSAVTELGSGVYTVDFAGADLNGATVLLKCTAAGADDLLLTILTNP
jgi:hypothetical protein